MHRCRLRFDGMSTEDNQDARPYGRVSLFAAFGFLLYGGRLFLMLQRFPVESKGRRKKLQEVGYVTTICFSCFLIRCVMMCLNAFDKAADLDVLNHPILNFFYYLVCFHTQQ
ncbi:hypothetical protein PR202_gb07333 [Eleusine coracana subsp. coracana]|uniref:THH1/TOM1/TOM3 domain-containing protein n=1 Tax=Eleusine coracana subsp. coracana TaxID=191504 RepID=A0AAV5ECS4_ELECO|nr:hypothetical protein PR202_gb07333 [Eleusine coracana subsp. coracana]